MLTVQGIVATNGQTATARKSVVSCQSHCDLDLGSATGLSAPVENDVRIYSAFASQVLVNHCFGLLATEHLLIEGG